MYFLGSEIDSHWWLERSGLLGISLSYDDLVSKCVSDVPP
jgi:hypothetical protein